MNKKCKIKFEGVNKIILTLVVVLLYLLLFIGSDGGGVSTGDGGIGTELISAPQNGISFKVSSGKNNYGFDAMKDKTDAYISLEAASNTSNKKTSFNVIVNDHPDGALAVPSDLNIFYITGQNADGSYSLTNSTTEELEINSVKTTDDIGKLNINGCTGELDGYW